MKEWKKEHNEDCLQVLRHMINKYTTWDSIPKDAYAGWLGGVASMIGHLAAATGNKTFVSKWVAEGMNEFVRVAAEKKSKKDIDKSERL